MSEAVSEQAIDWALRVADPDFADWDALSTWLAADPAHGAAYQAVVAAVEAAGPAAAQAPVAVMGSPARPQRRGWLIGGGAIAASIAGLIAWSSLPPASQRYLVQTGPGARQRIDLAGSSIMLNGDTRLWLDRRDPRVATLERGEAFFDVRHDASHPFTVRAGAAVLQDVGTRFDVTRDGHKLRLAVAEGAVVFNPGRDGVRVDAGRELEVDGGAAELRQASQQAIGGWRDGRLVFVRSPLATVAADLSRATGAAIVAGPEVSGRPFTGVISLSGDRQALLAELGPLLDVSVGRQGGRVLLGDPRPRS